MSSAQPLAVSRLWPVFGHEWAVEYLQRVIETGPAGAEYRGRGPRHAYLLVGPAQVGKSTLARAFAQALLCTSEGERPCGECRSCRLMQRGAHPDFRLVQPIDAPLDKDWKVDRAGGMLRAEQAAVVIRDAALSPVEGRYRIFVIQDAHRANDSFSNKLLKTLEEPPEGVVLCLTALDRASLLPTIVSRCEALELRPLSAPEARAALMEGWKVSGERAELLARLCNGRLGWAVRQLEDEAAEAKRLERLQELWRLAAAGRIARLDFAGAAAAQRENQQLFDLLEAWTTWWRDVLLVQNDCPDAICNVDQRAEVERQAALLPEAAVRRYLETLRRVERYLHHTVNTRLALDVLVLGLPRLPAQAGA